MKKLVQFTVSVMLVAFTCTSAISQRYDNAYSASTASLLQVYDSGTVEHTVNGAAILLPNGSNELQVVMKIPYAAVNDKPSDDTDFVSEGYQFNLVISVNVNEIQSVLTSEKRFSTYGFLTLNNITKAVDVAYMPIVSGTEENGNFKLYMNVLFMPADFKLDAAGSKRQFVISLNNAVVNRI